MRGQRGDICLCRISRTVRRIWNSLCEEVHRLGLRSAGLPGDRVLRVVLGDHIQRMAYQKLWISPIIKSITLSKAILTMNMYIIAHQFIFKIICLDNIKLLT